MAVWKIVKTGSPDALVAEGPFPQVISLPDLWDDGLDLEPWQDGFSTAEVEAFAGTDNYIYIGMDLIPVEVEAPTRGALRERRP